MKGDFDLLLYLGQKCKLFNEYQSSTLAIAKDIGLSQQTVSRRLIAFENFGLIKRKVSQDGIIFSIDNKGIVKLKNIFYSLNSIFDTKAASLTGAIVTGLGEGGYYISKYKKKINEKFGFSPFPGTLNLKVNKSDKLRFLSYLEEEKIDGFNHKDRTFGAISCYKVMLKNTVSLIVIPERTTHKEEIIELVSPYNLRKKFNLLDNQMLEIKK